MKFSNDKIDLKLRTSEPEFGPHVCVGVPLQHCAGKPSSLLLSEVSLRGRPEGGRDEADIGVPREPARVVRTG